MVEDVVMQRRDFIVGLSIATAAAPLAAQQGKVWRLGWLWPAPGSELYYKDFVQRMRELGYVEGENLILERRAKGSADQLPDLAAELVRLNVDVIVAVATPGAMAAKRATTTIPIVMLAVTDPVAIGLVSSYARPGGNITGLAVTGSRLSPKRLELLKEVLPTLSRVGVLINPNLPSAKVWWQETEIAAEMMQVTLQRFEVRAPGEIEAAYAAIDKAQVEAVIVITDPVVSTERRRRSDLAASSRIPVMNIVRATPEQADLMSYGPSYQDLYRRAAVFVNKILNGAKPAELPVEEPVKFELVINLKTAHRLGITIPPSVLLRADELIE